MGAMAGWYPLTPGYKCPPSPLCHKEWKYGCLVDSSVLGYQHLGGSRSLMKARWIVIALTSGRTLLSLMFSLGQLQDSAGKCKTCNFNVMASPPLWMARPR